MSRRALTIGFAVVFTVFAPVGIVTATAGAPAPSAPAPVPATTTRHSAESLGDFRAHVTPTEAERAAAAQAAREAAAWDRLIAALRAEGPGVLNPPTPPTPPTPKPAVVQPVTSGGGYNDPSNPAAWDRIARCESGGNWATNTGNGYYGGIQFSLGSWQSVGGTGRPDQASRETQIAMGQRLYHSGGGWSHWPGCSRALGYR